MINCRTCKGLETPSPTDVGIVVVYQENVDSYVLIDSCVIDVLQ